MTEFKVVKQIQALPQTVFQTVAHIHEFAKVIPNIVDVEFLSDQHTGVGTRFRETRNMNGRHAIVELEVTEYEFPSRCRLISDTNGCIWDTVFLIEPTADGSQLTMIMEARPYRFVARIMTWAIKNLIAKAVNEDMERVRLHFESSNHAD